MIIRAINISRRYYFTIIRSRLLHLSFRIGLWSWRTIIQTTPFTFVMSEIGINDERREYTTMDEDRIWEHHRQEYVSCINIIIAIIRTKVEWTTLLKDPLISPFPSLPSSSPPPPPTLLGDRFFNEFKQIEDRSWFKGYISKVGENQRQKRYGANEDSLPPPSIFRTFYKEKKMLRIRARK